MFYPVALSTLLSPLLASASVTPRQTGNCNTGNLQCCEYLLSSDSPEVVQLACVLGIDLTFVEGLVGLGCSDLSILGAGGNSCSAQPACCTGSNFDGLLEINCNPLNINL